MPKTPEDADKDGLAAYAGAALGSPSDYGFKVPTSYVPVELTKKLRAQIADGRLAMLAIIGMFSQNGLNGSAWDAWALCTASPLRALENESGVQDLVNFGNPLEFTANGDLLTSKRRRCMELTHGRVSMLATMGSITPEIIEKLPGCPNSSMVIKFADIPNNLLAVSLVPAAEHENAKAMRTCIKETDVAKSFSSTATWPFQQ